MGELVPIRDAAPVDNYRMSTDAASVCKDIVVATSSNIQGRKYVSVEGWQAIAIAHGCAAGSGHVERVEGGVRAVGEVRRMSDGQLIATAEGFVGEDEETWFGGKNKWGKELPKRADYAIRAMAQTRAISRACRSAFAHVVVMMNANLQTTPAEEIPVDGFDRDTGEVFEMVPTNEPTAREKLDGAHTSKTALKAAIVKVTNAVRKAETLEALAALKVEHRQTINQALRDWPELVNGDPNVPEDIGLKGAFAFREQTLTPAEESPSFQLLMSVLAEVTTPAGLQNFMVKHDEVIAALDGEESRRFEAAFQAREIGLNAVERITAGA